MKTAEPILQADVRFSACGVGKQSLKQELHPLCGKESQQLKKSEQPKGGCVEIAMGKGDDDEIGEEAVPEVESFDITLECGKCGKMVRSGDQLMKFVLCGCPNKTRICLQNRRFGAQLLGGDDPEKTYVHVKIGSQTSLPRMTLARWNQLQQRFKTQGSLTTPTKPLSRANPKA
jgi:hypothetical protein